MSDFNRKRPCAASRYREWNALIDSQVPDNFMVGLKTTTKTPSSEAIAITAAIIGASEHPALYVRHRLHCFRQFCYQLKLRCEALQTEIARLQLAVKGELQFRRSLTRQASDLISSLGVPSSAPQVQQKEAAYQVASDRLTWRKQAIVKAEKEHAELCARWELYEEIWNILEEHRIKEDMSRREAGQRQIWDIGYDVGSCKLPDGDEWSATGDTPPPTPPLMTVEEEEEASRQLTDAVDY